MPTLKFVCKTGVRIFANLRSRHRLGACFDPADPQETEMNNTEQARAVAAQPPRSDAAVASRRSMLFGASAVAAGAAALAVASRSSLPAPASPTVQTAPEKGGGYRVTPHNLHYYATTLV